MARLLRDNRTCSVCVLILAEDGPLRLRDGVKEKTRVAGTSGVSLLTDKKVTKVSDESFGFALGEGGRQDGDLNERTDGYFFESKSKRTDLALSRHRRHWKVTPCTLFFYYIRPYMLKYSLSSTYRVVYKIAKLVVLDDQHSCDFQNACFSL